MSVFTSEIVDSFPRLVRGASSRNSEEREEIRAMLGDGLKHKVSSIDDEKTYNALQQRIRGVAKSMGIGVTVQRGKDEGVLYLQGETIISEEIDPRELVDA